jgi:hypothetical protein
MYEHLSSHSTSQEIRLGRISEDVSERPTPFYPRIWTLNDGRGHFTITPKLFGVYSVRISDDSELGIVWKTHVIKGIISGGVRDEVVS